MTTEWSLRHKHVSCLKQHGPQSDQLQINSSTAIINNPSFAASQVPLLCHHGNHTSQYSPLHLHLLETGFILRPAAELLRVRLRWREVRGSRAATHTQKYEWTTKNGERETAFKTSFSANSFLCVCVCVCVHRRHAGFLSVLLNIMTVCSSLTEEVKGQCIMWPKTK